MIKKIIILIMILIGISSVSANNINNNEFLDSFAKGQNIQGLGLLHDPDSFTNPTAMFNEDNSTPSSKSVNSAGPIEWTIGETFNNVFIENVYIYSTWLSSTSSTFTLQTYDGTTWTDNTLLGVSAGSTLTFNDVIEFNESTQGLRIQFEDPSGASQLRNAFVYEITYNLENTSRVNYYNSSDYKLVSSDAYFDNNVLANFVSSTGTFPSALNNGTFNGYTLNDGTLTNMDDADRIGHNFEATIIGATWVDDTLTFDGSNDYVEQTTMLDNGLTTGTICKWIKPNTDSSAQYSLTKENSASNDRLYFQYNFPSNQQIGIRFALDGGGLITSSGSAPYNVWTHVCGVFDGTNQIIYINGAVADTDANGGVFNAGTQSNFRWGVRTGTSDYFNGSISDTKIFNFALNSSQISSVANNETIDISDNDFNREISFLMNEGQGNTIYDTSSQKGKFKGALAFDGTNDYVSIPDSAALDTTSEITVSTWIKSTSTATNDGIVGKRWSTGTASWFINTAASGTVNWHVWDGGNVERTIASSTDIHDGQWHYLTTIVNSTSQAIYVDGVLDSSVSAITGMTAGTSLVSIGSYFSSGEAWQGQQDEVRIWNVGLTPQQIITEMNSRNPVIKPQASYSFSETAGTNTFDTNMFVQGNTTDELWNRAVGFTRADSQYVDLGSGSLYGTTDTLSFSLMINPKSFANTAIGYTFGNDFDTYFETTTGGELKIRFENSSGGRGTITTDTVLNIDTWYHLVTTYDGSTVKAYIDGVQDAQTASLTGDIDDSIGNHLIGGRSSGLTSWNGSLGNFEIYNIALTQAQVTSLFERTFFNTSNLVGRWNAQQIDNTKLYDKFEQLCYNCTTVSNSYNSLSDGVYTNYLIDMFNGNSNYAVLFFDTIDPVITNTIPSEFNNNNKTIDISSFISVDYGVSGESSCLVSFSTGQSAMCSNNSLKFSTSGNITYSINAIDLSNNSVTEAGLIYVNPNQFFQFNNTVTGRFISNYTFNDILFLTNTSTFKLYDIGLGNQSFLFNKSGFPLTNVNFTTTVDSELNITTLIGPATIIVKVFDRQTFNLINGSITSITLIGTTGANGTTTTGLLNLTSELFIDETYQIIAGNLLYSSESVFFEFTNQETLEVNLYLLNATSPNAGTINLIVKDTVSQFVEGAVCSLLEWRPTLSAFVSVAQEQTNINGQAQLNIELDTKLYRFSCTKNGITTITNSQIIHNDLSTLTIVLGEPDLLPDTFLENILFSFTNATLNSSHQRLTFTFSDSDGLVTEGCIQLTRVDGNRETFINQTCVSSSTAIIVVDVAINNSFDLRADAIVSTSTISSYVLDVILFKSTFSFERELNVYGLNIIIPALFIILSIGLGMAAANIELAVILTFISVWLANLIVPSTMTVTIALVVSVICGLMLYGGFKRK